MPKYSYGKDGEESSVGFGGTKPKQTKSKAAKTFNQLVRSIYRSTIMAQRKVDEQVVEHFLDRFFDKDGHPNLFRLNLPTHDGKPVEVLNSPNLQSVVVLVSAKSSLIFTVTLVPEPKAVISA